MSGTTKASSAATEAESVTWTIKWYLLMVSSAGKVVVMSQQLNRSPSHLGGGGRPDRRASRDMRYQGKRDQCADGQSLIQDNETSVWPRPTTALDFQALTAQNTHQLSGNGQCWRWYLDTGIVRQRRSMAFRQSADGVGTAGALVACVMFRGWRGFAPGTKETAQA